MAMPLLRRGLPGLAALLVGAGAAACTDDPPADPPAEYIAVRRAWLPGERDAYIQRVMTNHELVFPYVGDISDMAPQLYADPDSHVVMEPNPELEGTVLAPPVGLQMAPQFNAAWNFIGLKITTINSAGVPPDTLFWHMVVWSDPSNALDHGFAIASSRAATFNISPINATAFDASAATAGAAAGEFHASTGTLWLDDAGGGRFRVDAQAYPGAFTTITSGPYLGGLARSGMQYGRIQGSKFVRQIGTEKPNNFNVNFDYRVAGVPSMEIVCDFPTPCTTNVPGLMADLAGGGAR